MGDFSRSVALKALEMKKQGKSQNEIYEVCKMGIVTIRNNLNQEQLAIWDSYPDYITYTVYIDNRPIFKNNYPKGDRLKNKKEIIKDLLNKIVIKGD